MPVSVAIVGPPGSGKTALWRAMAQGRGADGVAMVDVPDPRLDRLAATVRPKKVVHAQVRVVDAPPGSRAQRVAAAREADVVIKVAPFFGPAAEPVKALEEIEMDLILADLASVEKRLETLARELRAGRKGAEPEASALERAKQHLESGQALVSLDLDADATGWLAGLAPATLKPSVYVANIADDRLPNGGDALDRLTPLAVAARATRPLTVCAALEAELLEMSPQEATEYRAAYGLPDSTLAELARAIWQAGGLITFFTAGEPEVRAWPCDRDAPAPVAAGVIHTDFLRSFIRAEVTSVDELCEAGSMEALRAAGRLRVEGREYVVKDGDVIFFRVGR